MRIGIIADIHGNRPALEAVLESPPPVDKWICAGDVVGYYPDVNEVCRILISLEAWVIQGNHDSYVTERFIANPNKQSAYRTEWTRKNLRPEYLHWIHSLPVELNLSLGSKRIRVRHASPWDEETYLYPDSSRLAEIHLERAHYLFLGHTHHPMMVPAGEGWLVNPGSVGQPRDYNPAASYAVLDVESGVVELRRARYDVVSYQRYLEKLGWPESTILTLSRTREINRL